MVIAEKLSPIGLAGLGLILVSLVYLVVVTLPEWKQERTMNSQLIALTHRLGEAPQLTTQPSAPIDESPLPTEADLPGILAAIARLAANNQLPFPAADYTWTPSTASSFGQYELLFETKGGYLAIRHFIEDVENDQPAIALRELSLTREAAGQMELRARLHLVIFTQGHAK